MRKGKIKVSEFQTFFLIDTFHNLTLFHQECNAKLVEEFKKYFLKIIGKQSISEISDTGHRDM